MPVRDRDRESDFQPTRLPSGVVIVEHKTTRVLSSNSSASAASKADPSTSSSSSRPSLSTGGVSAHAPPGLKTGAKASSATYSPSPHQHQQVTYQAAEGGGGADLVHPQPGRTVIVSNSSSCTLQFQAGSSSSTTTSKGAAGGGGGGRKDGDKVGGGGGGGPAGGGGNSGGGDSTHQERHSKTNVYTVQFNRERTRTTTVGLRETPISADDNSASEGTSDGRMSTAVVTRGGGTGGGGAGGMGKGGGGGGGAAVIVPDKASRGSRVSLGPTSPMSQASNMTTRQIAHRTRPCCFCWCCCCSCSWIRRRCLSVKAPNGSLENETEFIKDSELGNISSSEVKSWGESFEKLMASEKGRKVFRAFLRCEYSEENILFWLACEDLKREMSAELIEEKARIIYEDYVSILSPREVSLDSRVREIINRNMIAPSQHTFDEAQLQIYTLMHRDSYPRFVNSPTYKELLKSCGATLPAPIGGDAAGAANAKPMASPTSAANRRRSSSTAPGSGGQGPGGGASPGTKSPGRQSGAGGGGGGT